MHSTRSGQLNELLGNINIFLVAAYASLVGESIHSANPPSAGPRADSFHTFFSGTVRHPDVSAPTDIEGSRKQSVEKQFLTLGNAGLEQVTDGSSRARRLVKKAVQQGRRERRGKGVRFGTLSF